MGRKYLGEFFDIHTGACDNVFPHHECEMAQAAVLGGLGQGGRPLAKYWLHSGPVTVEGQAMDLKNRNVVSVHELLESGFRGRVIRAALLSERYSDTLDFGEATLGRARDAVNVFLGFRERLLYASSMSEEVGEASSETSWIAETNAKVAECLDDDLDYWGALTAVVEMVDGLSDADVGSARCALDAIGDWDRIFGLL